MIQTSSSARPEPAVTAATRELDFGARRPLLQLLGWGVFWLVVSMVLGLIAVIQLHTPSFLADCSLLTYGRTQAMQETVAIYGWAANAAIAVSLWILGRLGGAPLRGLGLLQVGTAFWNIGVLVGVGCIAFGQATSIPFLQMPAYVHPLLLISYAAMAVPGVLAWTGRANKTTFAAQWYAVAGLFLFPWLYSAAQVMLLGAPVTGTAHAVVTGWFVQNTLTLWLAPVALASAYYLIPKLTGRVLSNYDFAAQGFWALLFFGSFTGARHLIGGPVPAWLPSLAIAAQVVLLYHYLIVTLNLRAGFRGQGQVLSFVSVGLVIYLFGGVVEMLLSFRGFAETVQFTYVTLAQVKFLVGGAFSFVVFGAIYHLVPRITGFEWPSAALLRAHYALALFGLLIAVGALAAAGWRQGQMLHHSTASFTEIAAATKPWLLAATAGEVISLLGALVFGVHYFRVAAASALRVASPAGVRSPASLEASVS